MAVIDERPEEKPRPSAADHVVGAVREMAHALHEERLFQSATKDAIEEGIHTARMGIRRGVRTLENATDDVILRVRRRPLQALTGVFGIGLALGIAVGWLTTKRRQRHA